MAKDQTNPDPEAAFAVSVHDVSPLTREAVEAMLGDLRAAGVTVTSLLVVPDHHRKGPLDRDPAFLEWLRARELEGHEVVLHGFYHLRENKGGGLGRRLITEHYTAGEGEFYDLGYEEARTRLARGREMLDAFDVAGFIAPAWLLGPEAERAVRDEGFAYTTRLGGVLDLRSGARTDSQSLVYSVRNGWRRGCSLAWNSWLAARLRSNPLMRLGLHPPDWRHAGIKAHALRLASEGARARRVIRYRDWVGV
jgi:predicted deacetylase